MQKLPFFQQHAATYELDDRFMENFAREYTVKTQARDQRVAAQEKSDAMSVLYGIGGMAGSFYLGVAIGHPVSTILFSTTALVSAGFMSRGFINAHLQNANPEKPLFEGRTPSWYQQEQVHERKWQITHKLDNAVDIDVTPAEKMSVFKNGIVDFTDQPVDSLYTELSEEEALQSDKKKKRQIKRTKRDDTDLLIDTMKSNHKEAVIKPYPKPAFVREWDIS